MTPSVWHSAMVAWVFQALCDVDVQTAYGMGETSEVGRAVEGEMAASAQARPQVGQRPCPARLWTPLVDLEMLSLLVLARHGPLEAQLVLLKHRRMQHWACFAHPVSIISDEFFAFFIILHFQYSPFPYLVVQYSAWMNREKLRTCRWVSITSGI